MRLGTAFIVVLALMSLAGCGDDVQCGEGTELIDGSCVIVDAGTDGDTPEPMDKDSGGPSCGSGTRLVGDECVPDAAKKPIGAACTAGGECATGTCAPNADNLPGGYCTVIGCNMDNPCPNGSTCYAVNKTLSICMAYCDRGTECREGNDDYHCQPLYTNDVNICAPSCELTDSCSAGTRCNTESGLCELAECEVGSSNTGCTDKETCYRDSRGLSSKGGLCLNLCDPAKPGDTCVVDKDEVCQPLADDPSKGFCAPPVCSKNSECPAGAECKDRVCLPPALCDGDSQCPDDKTCVSGKCMRKCPSGDDSCSDAHPGLVCADVLSTPACLPLGSFPGSDCRTSGTSSCDSAGGTPMVCEDGTCLADCTSGGDPYCSGLSSTLQCARGILSKDVCLPKGTYPGSACGANNSCSQDLNGNPDVDMTCVEGTCVVTCSESNKWGGYGDALCSFVDSSLTCAESAGSICVRACGDNGTCASGYSCLDAGSVPDHENACLPSGSFPGSACRPISGDQCDSDLGGNDAVDMVCANDVCVVSCPSNNDALCGGVDSSLTCSETAGNICVLECDGGDCASGYACFDAGGENACLPDGSFPGSPCRNTSGDECDQNVGGNDAVDMVCASGVCAVSCGDNNDALCTGVDSSLTCSESAGDVCVIGCVAGNCLTGYSCLDAGGENACLPTGSFPGSPCRATSGDECDQNLGGVDAADMACVSGTCVVSCPNDNDELCGGVDESLTCSESGGNVCVLACDEGDCATGFSCLDPGDSTHENACLPNGTFPGSACRTTGAECDENLGGNAAVDMECVEDVCVVSCASNNDVLCAAVDESLTCSESADDVCVLACDEGACPTGYSCLDPTGENACLPDGSFPGSACRSTSGDECDENLGGNSAVDMECVRDTCVVSCPSDNDALCGAVDSALTCSESAGDFCVVGCVGGNCLSGFSCLDAGGENACLPTGSFPGSPCRATSGDECDQDVGGVSAVDMSCVANTCVITCATNNDALCAAVDGDLTCAQIAGNICVLACDAGNCPTGFSCFVGENACLPDP